ncbi:MAG TPA: DUF362 domain-containing protein [Verrucomicrobiae bacterium]|nr:DUF362 domain-containing protein [Verrucomicrobiae bacterium]
MNQSVVSSREVGFFHNPKSAAYPKKPPFSPSESYPEYPFGLLSKKENAAYAAVREMFYILGYDKENFGTKKWNPFKDIVRPGDTVVIKPNFVREAPYVGGDQDALMTHGSVIRAAMDYVAIALKGKGKIILGDAPIQTANFEKIVKVNGIQEIISFYQKQGVDVELVDFRTERTHKTFGSFVWKHETIGSADDWIIVDMGTESELDAPDVDIERLRAPNYDRKRMRERHDHGKHEYLINRRVLEADVVINLSKLKTHRLGGLTCSMKNLVGILAHKSCLAHYSAGSREEGGDEYAKRAIHKKVFSWLIQQEDSARALIKRAVLFVPRMAFHFITKKGEQVFEGSWYQNDTMWRMVIDLNRAVLYANRKGELQQEQQRRYWCMVDGLVAGEKNGPLMPVNKPIGVLVAGENPVAVDFTCAEIMGFDINMVKTVSRSPLASKHPLIDFPFQKIEWLPKKVKLPNFHFIPHKNWVGHLERKDRP